MTELSDTEIVRRLADGEDPWEIDPEYGCVNPLTGYFPAAEVDAERARRAGDLTPKERWQLLRLLDVHDHPEHTGIWDHDVCGKLIERGLAKPHHHRGGAITVALITESGVEVARRLVQEEVDRAAAARQKAGERILHICPECGNNATTMMFGPECHLYDHHARGENDAPRSVKCVPVTYAPSPAGKITSRVIFALEYLVANGITELGLRKAKEALTDYYRAIGETPE